MNFKLATYNIQFNQAHNHLREIFQDEKIEIICLQEVKTSESNLRKIENKTLRLADYANSFIKHGEIFGVATFYDKNKFEFLESKSIDLPQSFFEIFLIILGGINRPRTALKTDFIYKPLNKKVSVYNLHLTHLVATNGIRKKQIKEVLQNIKQASKNPIIVAGDFNYPYGRKKFEEIIEEHNLKEATTNIYHTLENWVVKYLRLKTWSKFDYVLYKNIKHIGTKKISVRHSDHYPIISEFELE